MALKLKEKETKKQANLDNELVPPCDGAHLYTCGRGPNEGCRYWAVKSLVDGNYSSRFVSWVDPPKMDLKTRVEVQEKKIAALKKRIQILKDRSKSDGMEDSSDSD